MTIHFPDLSHHKQVSLEGAVALITKATEGTSFVDPSYAGYKADAAKRGIPFCAFHWLHAANVAGQAKHCFSVVGPGVPLMIDDEDPTDGLSLARTLAFVQAYRALGGLVKLEYLPRWFWSNHGSPDLRPLAKAGLALVSSAYPRSGYTEQGVGWLPYGGVYPAIWQYTDAHPFNGQAVDFNAFKGTVDDLRVLWGLSTSEGYVGTSEWHTGEESGAFLTQGNPGYAKQQRDTALAFTWEAAHEAMTAAKAALVKCDEILAAIAALGGGGGTGATVDQIRKVVDEELDEAFRGGADNDPASP